MTSEQAASLAKSLVDNEVFQQVLANQRSSALETLATIDHSDAQKFYAAQAIVAVIDGIKSDLDAFVRGGQPKKKPGLA